MDPRLLCASFRPPAPLSLEAHFDAVTRDRAKNVGALSIYTRVAAADAGAAGARRGHRPVL